MAPDVAEAAAIGQRHASDHEQLRRLHDETAAAIVASGMGRAFAPKEVGGSEADVADVLSAIVQLSHADGATAWCAMIAATTSLIGGRLPDPYLEQIYGDPNAITGGFAAPVGSGRSSDDGGLVVDGRWQWGSGAHHCTWIGGGVRIVDDPPRADGAVAPFVLFDRSQVELLDTWHVAGLKGTGSTDYVVASAAVPPGRWADFSKPPSIDRPLYRFSFLGALAVGVAGVTVGLARRAIDELISLAPTKTPQGSGKTLDQRPAIQAEVAQAIAAVRSSRALLDLAVADATADAERGATDDGHRVALRLAAVDATVRCAEAVDRCYHAAGGVAVYESSPLQRVFRDIHVATQHAMVAPRIYEVVGRHALGLPTDLRSM